MDTANTFNNCLYLWLFILGFCAFLGLVGYAIRRVLEILFNPRRFF